MNVAPSSINVDDVGQLCQLPPSASPTSRPISKLSLTNSVNFESIAVADHGNVARAESHEISSVGPRNDISFSITTLLPGTHSHLTASAHKVYYIFEVILTPVLRLSLQSSLFYRSGIIPSKFRSTLKCNKSTAAI